MANDRAKLAWIWIRDIFVVILIPLSVTATGLIWRTINNQSVMIMTQQATSETLKNIQNAQTALLDRVRPLELWKAETAGNRFTKSDGYDLAQKSAERDSKLTEQIMTLANIVASIPTETPNWITDRMDKLEDKIDRISAGVKGSSNQ